MKKSIIIILALLSLASCSNNSVNEQPEKTIIIETTTAEETTQETEIPPATTREEIEKINEVLYEDDNVKIIYDGYESLKTVQTLYLTIENKKDSELRCKWLDFKANETPIEQYFETKRDPHSSFTNAITISNSKFQDANITRVNKMEFNFNIWFEPIIEKATGPDGEIQTTTAIGKETYDTGVLTIER